MKRVLAAALLAALLVAVPAAHAATFVSYRTIGPIPLCVRCGNSPSVYPTYGPTGWEADSVARNFNTALVGGSIDTTVTVDAPEDMAWGALTDSLPIFVVVRRIGGTGNAADSVQVVLQASYSGTSWQPVPAAASNTWPYSGYALIGARTGGYAMFKLGAQSTSLLPNAVNTYTGIPGYGATSFRVIARSISVAASAGRYSVFLRVPVVKK